MKKSLFFALIACVALVFVGCEPPVPPVDYTVKISATELTMDMENNKSAKLTAVVTPTPANATYPLVWTSSNPEVVTVNASGIVEAVGLGTATITVTINVPEGDETVASVTPAICSVEVTNDAVLNTFELGGFSLFDLGNPIEGTDTILKISAGEVTCQLAPALYYVWDKGITMVGNSLAGAGFIMPLETFSYVITDSPNGAYNGYYISGFDVVIDTLASAEEALAYSAKNGVYAAPYGQLLDETMYGDAWDAILNFSEEPTEDEINAAYDLYYGSQTGTPFFHLNLNTGSQSYYYGNVSYLYLTEDRETGELYYALRLEWYDHVNIGRWFGLLAEYELDEEGNEVPTAIVKPYDMRKINKEYLVLPPAEEEEPTEVKAIQPKKPIQLNAKQAELLKKSTIRSMYKK